MTTSDAARLVLLLVLTQHACADRHARGPERDGQRDGDAAVADGGSAEPLRIDPARLNVVLEDERVHVIGERGAVTPGGIDVEVQWVAAEELERGRVAADGSFDVTIAGWVLEPYRVQAVRRSPPARSAPVFVARTASGIATGAYEAALPDGSEPDMCTELSFELGERWYSADIGGRCASDSDCTVVTHEGCGGQCWGAAVPRGTESVVEAGFSARRDSLCAQYARAGCLVAARPFDMGCDVQRFEPRCVDGTCTSCAAERCSELELCQRCPWPEIYWGPIGVEPGAAHSLRQCRAFRSISADGPPCEGSVPCVQGLHGRGGYIVSALISALSDSDVQDALARHAYFGKRTAEEVGIEVTVGTGSLTVSAARCDGSPGCESPPQMVMWLRDQLNAISIQQRDRCR